jgi:hypothetical protein
MFAVVMSPVYQDLASQDSSESGPGRKLHKACQIRLRNFTIQASVAPPKLKSSPTFSRYRWWMFGATVT